VLSELGRPEDARNAFGRAVEADSNSAEAHYNLSFALSKLGDYDGALRTVTRAQTLDPYYVPQKFRLSIDLQYEDPDLSVVPEISADVMAETTNAFKFDQSLIDNLFAELDSAARHEAPVSTSDPLALARDYLDKGLLDLAAAETDRAANRGADPVDMQILSGHIYARQGLHGEALERYRGAKSADPDSAAARLGEIRQLVALGRGAEAVADAAALASDHPDNVDVLVALAETQLAAGDPANALGYLEEARGRAPQRADILKLEGDIAVDMGDLEAAQNAYEGALDLEPRFAQVRLDLGKLHEARNDLLAAERSYRAALETLPTLSDAAIALAQVYRRAGRSRLAVNLLIEVLQNDPSDLETLIALGQSLLDDGRVERAVEAFGRVLTYQSNHAGAHFYLGVASGRQRCYTEAIARTGHSRRLSVARFES
jgi:tetratricopeptide (TPR) repeat protein